MQNYNPSDSDMQSIPLNLDANTYDYLSYASMVRPAHQLLKQKKYPQAIAQLQQLQTQLPLDELTSKKSAFSRFVFCNDDNYWLTVIHWNKGYCSKIHGHPKQAFVYIIKGKIFNQNYHYPPLEKQQSEHYRTGDHFYIHGTSNQFDNSIHHMHAQQNTLSLHFYSDDARKGKSFGAATQTI